MGWTRKLKGPGTVAAAIILFFMVDRALMAGFLLPWYCNEDERWVRGGAVKMAREQSIDPGSHKYPELMTALTAGVYGAAYLSANLRALPHFESWRSFAWHRAHYAFGFVSTVVWGRMLAAGLGALALLIFYRLAKKESGEETALLALLLFATAPAYLFSTILLKPDALLMIGVLLAVWSSLRVLERGSGADYVLAGLAAGLCLAAKYHVPALVPALIAHRLRRRDLPLARSFLDARWLIIIVAAAAAFAALSPITWLDLPGAMRQAGIELHIQRLDPLLLRSSKLWWQAPVLFQLTSVLPLALGIPLYLMALAGLLWRGDFRNPRMIVLWSYPAGLLVFMMAVSRLGAPQLYTMVVPFFALAAARLIAPWAMTRSRVKTAAAVALVAGVAAYNLVLYHSLIGLEDRIAREATADLASTHRPGRIDLAFMPYYPNPDLTWTCKFVPQFMLSRKLIRDAHPDRILLHHAFYNAYLDNPELTRDPRVADMVALYLELRLNRAGYREVDRWAGESFNSRTYAALLPDLEGLMVSIYEKEKNGPRDNSAGGD
ncbi:MAG TPA: glycosyltransferase family 39 protein [bacterium]|nr:glycosyltransferase family 39 protein [bacterium]